MNSKEIAARVILATGLGLAGCGSPGATVEATRAASAATISAANITSEGIVAAGTPEPELGANPTYEHFSPYKTYEQSCEPERTEGCSWDIGVKGSYIDHLGRPVAEIGIVKGVDISWEKGQIQADSDNYCELVVLPPDNWYENLNIRDVNVSIYAVDTTDTEGWQKVLAVQAAQEQTANYDCPSKTYEEIPVWRSDVEAPPKGVTGFDSVENTTSPINDCETVNCLDRRSSADFDGTAVFSKGEAVYGYDIELLNGESFNDCYLSKSESEGTVADGVVNPWKSEVVKTSLCD